MPKVTNPLFSGSASGQIGSELIFDSRGYVRKYFKPKNPRSALQVERRERFHDIQLELGMMQASLRAAAKSALGKNFHVALIGHILADGYTRWLSLAQTWNGFSANDKRIWEVCAPSQSTANNVGQVFFIVASALHEMASDLVSLPSSGNAAQISEEWQGGFGSFEDSFIGAVGALAGRWIYCGEGVWNLDGNGAVICTPGIEDNLVTNGDMESGDPPTGWIAGNGATISAASDERTGGAGVKSLRIVNPTPAQFGKVQQLISLSVGDWILLDLYGKAVTDMLLARVAESTNHGEGVCSSVKTTATTWSKVVGVGRNIAVSPAVIGSLRLIDGVEARMDDCQVRKLERLDFVSVVPWTSGDVRVAADCTVIGFTGGGVCGWLDTWDQQSNFLFAWYGGGYYNLGKYTGGQWTTLITQAVTYVAGAAVEMRGHLVDGNLKVKGYYNGVQCGSELTITESAIKGNRLFGNYSNYSFNTIRRFSIGAY